MSLQSITRNTTRQFSTSQCILRNQLDHYRTHKEWNEKQNVRKNIVKVRRTLRDKEYGNSRDTYLYTLQKIGLLFRRKGEFIRVLKQFALETDKHSQTFMEKRVNVLGPDLAAAHFIVNRGGSVKFHGHPEWVGLVKRRKCLPSNFLPGFYVEAIDAKGTGLLHEGLVTAIYDLKKLNWLSLKGLEKLNNFSLDVISSEYGHQLQYLDLTGCKGIDYNGLSCMYRFQSLKLLNLTDMNHTPDMRMSCLMLLDILPNLKIIGIDLSHMRDETDMNENIQLKKISSL